MSTFDCVCKIIYYYFLKRTFLGCCFCGTESVKDLIRYLRHEDDTRDIRQQLGESQIVQNDLLPIIVQYREDKALFDACIR